MAKYRLDRYGMTAYGATYYLRPMYFRTWVGARVAELVMGLWWNVYTERID